MMDQVLTMQRQLLTRIEGIERSVFNLSYLIELHFNVPMPEPFSNQNVSPADPISNENQNLPPATTPSSTAPPPPDLPAVMSTNPTAPWKELGLLTPAQVIAKYPRLRGSAKMGELAAKLARESFLGRK